MVVGFVVRVSHQISIALSLLVPTVARAGGRGKRVTRTVLNPKPAPVVPVFDLAAVGCGQNYINSAELI